MRAPSRRSPWRWTRPSRSPARPTSRPSTRRGARTLVRFGGFSFSVDYRIGELKRLLKQFGTAEILEGRAAEVLWQSVRDATVLAEPRDRAIWRVSTAPTAGPEFTAHDRPRARRALVSTTGAADSCGFRVDAWGDAGARCDPRRCTGRSAATRRSCARRRRCGRSSMCSSRSATPIMRLTGGIKASFDPGGILNPGRMYAGI